jgi:glycosyltransferase involved in cell wall biosynthesis
MLTNLYPPIVSGSSTQSAALARDLARRGCRVAVITANVGGARFKHDREDGVDVYRLPARLLPRLPIALNFPWLSYTFTPANLRRIDQIVTQHAPHVLHLHNHMFDLALSAVVVRLRHRIPLVTTIHTVLRHARPLYNLVLSPLDRFVLKHTVIRSSDAVICPDWNIEQYVTGTFQRSNAFLVPYGIDAPTIPAAEDVESLRKQFALAGKRVILSLGHVHELRNRRELIEALPAVLKVFPNAVVVMVGALSTRTPMDVARRLGVEHAVICVGHQPHASIPAFLALADFEAHWLTQDTPERTSLGIASMEAMNAGKAVLALANENTFGPEILKNGDNIVLARPGDPNHLACLIVDLLADDQRRNLIGRRASKIIRAHFSWESVCGKTLELYRHLSIRRTGQSSMRIPQRTDSGTLRSGGTPSEPMNLEGRHSRTKTATCQGALVTRDFL